MDWPPGRLNTSDQFVIAVGPGLVMVRFSVSPVFHALTVLPTWQAAVPGDGVVGLGDGVVGLGDGVVGLGDGVVGLGDGPVWNCEKKAQTTPLVQVLAPLSPPPSTAPGVCPPSKAAHSTGYPARQPE